MLMLRSSLFVRVRAHYLISQYARLGDNGLMKITWAVPPSMEKREAATWSPRVTTHISFTCRMHCCAHIR